MSDPISSFNLSRQLSVAETFTQRSRTSLRRDIASLSEQISTGLRINRPSDDAAGFEQAHQLDAFNEELKQYQRSIDASTHWVNATQDTLDGLGDQFSEAHERAVQAANDALGDDERAAIADRLRSIKDTVVSELNAKVNGEYLFAGNATQTKPFDDNGDPTAGDYSEISGDRERFIGPDERLKINITGREVHEVNPGESIVDGLDEMIDTLENNPDDQAAIQDALGRIEAARDHVIDRGAQAGNIANRLEIADGRLEDTSLRLEGRRSDIEDADLAETIMNFQNRQTSLQAALQVTASVRQTSLVNFL